MYTEFKKYLQEHIIGRLVKGGNLLLFTIAIHGVLKHKTGTPGQVFIDGCWVKVKAIFFLSLKWVKRKLPTESKQSLLWFQISLAEKTLKADQFISMAMTVAQSKCYEFQTTVVGGFLSQSCKSLVQLVAKLRKWQLVTQSMKLHPNLEQSAEQLDVKNIRMIAYCPVNRNVRLIATQGFD